MHTDKFEKTDLLNLLGKMFIHIDANHVIIDVNKDACAVLGYSKSEMIGKNWFNHFVPDENSPLNGYTVEKMDEFYDKPVLTKDGKERIISWQKTTIYDEEGNTFSYVCIGDDITKHENYLTTLHKISSLLLDYSPEVPYKEFVRLVGDAGNANHTYIFLNSYDEDGKISANKVSEWGRNMFLDNKDHLPGLKSLVVSEFASELTNKLEAGEAINLRTSSFPVWEQKFFSELKIKAILLIPIIVDGDFFGFIGFDNRENEREWTYSELEFLKAAVKNLEQRIIRSKTLEALKNENLRFQATMDAIESIVMVSDFQTDEVIYLNKFGLKMLGNVVGSSFTKVLNIDEPLPKEYLNNRLLLSEFGLPNDTREWELRSSINHKFYSCQVKAIRWINNKWVRLETVTDISAKKKSEISLRSSEAKFRKLSTITVEGIIIHEQGIVSDANEAFTKMFQYSLDELIGTNIIELVVLPEYHQGVFENLKIKNPNSYEIQARKKNGDIVPVEVKAKSISYDNEVLRVVAIRDITERNKAEKELIRQRNKAEESNKLKTQFLNNMSHEIRTPLNGIVGFTQFLDDPDLSEEKKKHFINIIQSSSNQLVRIIDDIIEISKLETKQVKPINEEVNLNSLLLELFSIFEIKAKEMNLSLHLIKGLNDQRSTILTDKTKLLKVLNNLVENALKFTHHGEVEIGYKKTDNQLIIWVKDSGIGVPEKNQKIIFERFSQAEKNTSRVYGGLGLGLSIAKENTHLLGGEITIQSKLNKGATFNVIIPYNPVHIEDELEEEDVLDSHQIKVLVAEDEEVNFMFLEFLLQEIQSNIQIVNVRNGQKAIEYCEENGDVDLVFMDLKMPLVDGFDATSTIKTQNSSIPIVAISAYSGIEDKERAKESGCDDFLTKPIDIEKFKSICKKYIVELVV
jgi:PAS domain S-box-containing protein